VRERGSSDARAINEDVGRALIREMAWYESYIGELAARPLCQTRMAQEGGLAKHRRKNRFGSIV